MRDEAACCPSTEVPFQRGIGVFLRNSERGFRGLDFQARLAWEDRYGACARPGWVDDGLHRRARRRRRRGSERDRRATWSRALKDRLIGEPAIAEGAERAALDRDRSAPLDAPADRLAPQARCARVCGALLGSPQFLLQGIAGRGGDAPEADAGERRLRRGVRRPRGNGDRGAGTGRHLRGFGRARGGSGAQRATAPRPGARAGATRASRRAARATAGTDDAQVAGLVAGAGPLRHVRPQCEAIDWAPSCC